MARLVRNGPLRLVIGHVWMPAGSIPYLIRMELLACGHAQRAVQDVFGATTATRRRCMACRNERQVLPELAALVERWRADGETGKVYHGNPLNLDLPDLIL